MIFPTLLTGNAYTKISLLKKLMQLSSPRHVSWHTHTVALGHSKYFMLCCSLMVVLEQVTLRDVAMTVVED